MASTFTDLLRLEKQNPGENEDTWGDNVNMVFEMIEDAIAGMAAISTTGGSTTLSTNNSVTDESRMAILKISGSLASNATIVIPSSTRVYWVWNNTSGSFTVTLKTAAGTGAVIAQGGKSAILCDGTDCHASTYAPNTAATIAGLTVTGALDLTGAALAGATPIVFEGGTDNGFETSVVVTNPTADRTITVPDANVDLTKIRAATTGLDGVVQLSTDGIAQAGTNTDMAVTPDNLGATVLGMGQTYQDMTASRASGVTYTNSTGRTIAVSAWGVTGGVTNQVASAYVSGVLILQASYYSNGSNYTAHTFFIVPPGKTYSITLLNTMGADDFVKWFELR